MLKPMNAGKVDFEKLIYPAYASPKIDGVRCVCQEGRAWSKSLTLIPNRYIQSILQDLLMDRLDGELVVGSATNPNAMQATTSGVMTIAGTPPFVYLVFDMVLEHMRYEERLQHLLERGAQIANSVMAPYVQIVPQQRIMSQTQLLMAEADYLSQGYEGLMTRSPDGRYKQGRSTSSEQYLLKLKRFSDGEAIVIGFEERLHNTNEATTNALGRTQRSSAKANLVPMGTLGALIVQDIESSEVFRLGSGFTDAQRLWIWQHQNDVMGALVTYKHFNQVGVLNAPRLPTFKAFRHPYDMSLPA